MVEEEITYKNNQMPTEKRVGPRNERGLPSWNYNRGKNVGEKTTARPRIMLLDCMMKEDYSKLKTRVGHRGEWRHWTYTNLPIGG